MLAVSLSANGTWLRAPSTAKIGDRFYIAREGGRYREVEVVKVQWRAVSFSLCVFRYTGG